MLPMRSYLRVSSLSSLIALVVLSGCNSAYRQAISRAEEAAVRGDFMTAAIAYRDACRASPDDEKACSRAPIFAQKATDQAIATARPACEAGDLDQCLPPLLAAKDLIPDHPEVNALLEKASQLQTQRCSQWKVDGPLKVATAELACLQSRAAQLPVPSYQALLADHASKLSSRFAELAATSQGPSSAGAADVLWSAAQCLAGGNASTPQVEQARSSFLTQSAIPVAVRVSGTMPPSIADQLTNVCDGLAANLAPAARCASSGMTPGQPPPLEVLVSASIERPRDQISQEMRSVRYVSGTRQVLNPEYAAAVDRFRHAEHDLHATEGRRHEREEACEKSKRTHEASCVGCTDSGKKGPCDEARDLAEEIKARTHDRNEARRYLDSVPETLTEDVYDDFMYSVLTHHWSAPYRFTVQSSNPNSTPTPPQEGMLSFEDQEHVGFAPGGLSPDPLEVPPSGAYASAFMQQLAPQVFAAVQQDSIARGTARRAQCSSLPEKWGLPWVQCWAEATLWERGQEPQAPEFLSLLAASAGATDAPQCR